MPPCISLQTLLSSWRLQDGSVGHFVSMKSASCYVLVQNPHPLTDTSFFTDRKFSFEAGQWEYTAGITWEEQIDFPTAYHNNPDSPDANTDYIMGIYPPQMASSSSAMQDTQNGTTQPNRHTLGQLPQVRRPTGVVLITGISVRYPA